MSRDIEKHKQRKHEWYLKNKDLTKKRTLRTSRKRREKTREFFEKLRKANPCQMCGESDFYCLDLHHINSETKEAEIAVLKRKDYFGEKLFNEIAKCSSVCKNCHAKIHANRFSKKDLKKLKTISYDFLLRLKEEIRRINQSGC